MTKDNSSLAIYSILEHHPTIEPLYNNKEDRIIISTVRVGVIWKCY